MQRRVQSGVGLFALGLRFRITGLGYPPAHRSDDVTVSQYFLGTLFSLLNNLYRVTCKGLMGDIGKGAPRGLRGSAGGARRLRGNNDLCLPWAFCLPLHYGACGKVHGGEGPCLAL